MNTTLTLEQLQELADFWSEEGDAVSVYFQPPVPSELKHREEPILAKDYMQQRLSSLRGAGPPDRADLQRILETITGMKGNHRRTKVIFACARKKFWREMDVRGDFGLRMTAGQAFSIAPLIAEQQARRRYCIALADRNRARLLILESGEIAEHSHVLDEEKEKIRTTGAGKSAKIERRKELAVHRHYTFLADHLLHFHEHGDYDHLLIGCRDEMWPEIEAALHPETRRILVGRFPIDPGLATSGEILQCAQRLVNEKDRREEQDLVQKAIGGAASDGTGAVGLPAVMEAMERGELWTLFWPKLRAAAPSPAMLCPNCAHLDAFATPACALCGTPMRSFALPEGALLRHPSASGTELRMLSCVQPPAPDGIAARLRFAARRNTARALAS